MDEDYGNIYVQDGARNISDYLNKNKNQKVWTAIGGRTPESDLRVGKKRKREQENQAPNKKSKGEHDIGDGDYLHTQGVLTYIEKGGTGSGGN